MVRYDIFVTECDTVNIFGYVGGGGGGGDWLYDWAHLGSHLASHLYQFISPIWKQSDNNLLN